MGVTRSGGAKNNLWYFCSHRVLRIFVHPDTSSCRSVVPHKRSPSKTVLLLLNLLDQAINLARPLPTNCAITAMEPTRDDLVDLIREGVFFHVHWTFRTVQQLASKVLVSTESPVTEVALMHCTFDKETTFRELLQVLVQQPLRRLSISQDDLSPVLGGLAAVLEEDQKPTPLEHLELAAHRAKIRDDDMCYLKKMVKIPAKTISISFSLKQKDYGPCLLAIRHGLDELKAAGKVTPQVSFRNVCFPDHENYLHRFLAMVCEARCVDTLQLNPRRRAIANESESMHLGPGFLPGLVRLLACGTVKSLEVTTVIVDKLSLDVNILPQLRQAVAQNTTLESLALSHTKGMASVWQQAIFPAMEVNRTLKRLEFGYENGLVKGFLEHLPLMKGLQSVQAPWRIDDGASWVAAVQQNQSLVQANLVEILDLHVHPMLKVEDTCLATTRQLLERNRLCHTAKQVVDAEPSSSVLVNELATMTIGEAGLDASFMVLRDSLTLFAH